MSDKEHSIQLPPRVYIPGSSPRHPANFFDDLKDSVTPDTPVEDLHHTRAFIAGLRFFHEGYFWECHEVLEAVWVHTRDPSPERDIVLALIQLSNARLKVIMRQPRAALRICDMVETRLARCPSDKHVLGLTVGEMRTLLAEARAIAKNAMQLP